MWYVLLRIQKIDFIMVEQLEDSLQAHKEKIKRKKEESLEQFIKLFRYPSKILEVKK